MKTTPEPTASTTVHPSCPPTWACDTPDGDGLKVFGWVALIFVVLLVFAAPTNKRRS